ncbi:hypothetical protein R7U33_03390 [Mesomycoplasma ovipneumoniae]|nr:hypothetical protein [Mesomycoplasma ovipneumoniae]MDW2861288.1 hypothetical protein [Mesomycoplasma ovipneumoniae]
MQNLDEFAEKWGQKYPSIIKSWYTNFVELTTFLNIHMNWVKKFIDKFNWISEK